MTDLTNINVDETKEYVLLIGSEKVKRTKNGHQTMLLGLSVVGEKLSGMMIWHNLMLVHATNKAMTANWLLRASRELSTMIDKNFPSITPAVLRELRDGGDIVGKAFLGKLKIESSDDYGNALRLDKIIRPVSPDELDEALGIEISEDIDFVNPTAAYAGLGEGETF